MECYVPGLCPSQQANIGQHWPILAQEWQQIGSQWQSCHFVTNIGPILVTISKPLDSWIFINDPYKCFFKDLWAFIYGQVCHGLWNSTTIHSHVSHANDMPLKTIDVRVFLLLHVYIKSSLNLLHTVNIILSMYMYSQPRPTHILDQCAKCGDDRTSFNVICDVCDV